MDDELSNIDKQIDEVQQVLQQREKSRRSYKHRSKKAHDILDKVRNNIRHSDESTSPPNRKRKHHKKHSQSSSSKQSNESSSSSHMRPTQNVTNQSNEINTETNNNNSEPLEIPTNLTKDTVVTKMQKIDTQSDNMKKCEDDCKKLEKEKKELKRNISSWMTLHEQPRYIIFIFITITITRMTWDDNGIVPRKSVKYKRITAKDVLTIIRHNYTEEQLTRVCRELEKLHELRYKNIVDVRMEKIKDKTVK